jgi:hypothetical protein
MKGLIYIAELACCLFVIIALLLLAMLVLGTPL